MQDPVTTTTPTAPVPPMAQLLDAPPALPPVQGVQSINDLFTEQTDEYANPVTDITAMLNNLPEPPAQQPTQTQSTQLTPPAVDWEKRYKDLQSYYDEQRIHWDKVQTALGSSDPNEVAQARAIRDAIVSDPELYGVVTQRLSGQPIGSAPAAPSGPPARPANFDADDLYTPGTPSYEWAQSMEQYKQAQLVSTVAQVVDRRLSAVEQRQQADLLRRQQEAARQATVNFASTSFQDPREADTFLRFVNDGPTALGLPRQLSLEHLKAIYSTLRQMPAGSPASSPQAPTADITARLDALKTNAQAVPPVTSVTQVAGEPSVLTPEQDFMAGLRAVSTKRLKLF